MKTAPGPDNTVEVSDEAIEVLVQSIRHFLGPASRNIDYADKKFWLDFFKQISFLESDRELYPSQDANSPIALQKECEIVQIAYWDESPGKAETGTLYVNRELWKELDQLNKIALLAHEFFFKLARRAHYKNSDAVRAKVGDLLSTNGLTPLFKSWTPSSDERTKEFLPSSNEGFKYCEGTSATDPTAKLQLYQYKGNDNHQYLVFPVIESSQINSASLLPASASFDPNTHLNMMGATDLLLFLSDFHNKHYNSLLKNQNGIDRLYFDNGIFYSDSESNTPRLNIFEQVIRENGNIPFVWSSHLLTSPYLLSIAITNIATLWPGEQKSVASREELISTVQFRAGAILQTCGISTSESHSALALLNKEITASIKTGTFSQNFQRWSLSLKKFEEKINQENVYRQADCKLSKNNKLMLETPDLLYQLMANNYQTDAIVNTLMQDPIYKARQLPPLPLGQIQVTQNAATIKFDLRCESYSSLFSELIESKRTSQKVLTLNKKVKNNFSLNAGDGINPSEVTQEDIDAAESFAKFLHLEKPDAETELFFQKYWDDTFANLWRPRSTYSNFLNDLKTENDIEIDSCRKIFKNDFDSAGEKYQHTTCTLVSMKTMKTKYRIYFKYRDSDESIVPFIEFIQHVTN